MLTEHSEKVLVIDDRPEARALMKRILTDAGYDVVAQASPIGATRQIVRFDIRVVVIDLNMPAMRGDKLAALFRGNSKLSHLGVILVSGEPHLKLVEIGIEVGADAVVQKADLLTCLVKEVETILHRRSAPPPG